LVEQSFQTYPEGDYAQNLIADVDAVNEGRISDLEREALTGNLEEFSENNGQANIVISVQEDENAEIKWGSFSTVWTMSLQEYDNEVILTFSEEDSQTWSVPEGVNKAYIEVEGPGGGAGEDNDFEGFSGGDGGYVEGSIDVSNKNYLEVYVAQGGYSNQDGGWGLVNGESSDPSGGGGLSAVLDADESLIMKAGGGGGGGTNFDTVNTDGGDGADEEVGGLGAPEDETSGSPGTGFADSIVDEDNVELGGGSSGGRCEDEFGIITCNDGEDGEVRIYYNEESAIESGFIVDVDSDGVVQTSQTGLVQTLPLD